MSPLINLKQLVYFEKAPLQTPPPLLSHYSLWTITCVDSFFVPAAFLTWHRYVPLSSFITGRNWSWLWSLNLTILIRPVSLTIEFSCNGTEFHENKSFELRHEKPGQRQLNFPVTEQNFVRTNHLSCVTRNPESHCTADLCLFFRIRIFCSCSDRAWDLPVYSPGPSCSKLTTSLTVVS